MEKEEQLIKSLQVLSEYYEFTNEIPQQLVTALDWKYKCRKNRFSAVKDRLGIIAYLVGSHYPDLVQAIQDFEKFAESTISKKDDTNRITETDIQTADSVILSVLNTLWYS